MREYELTIIIKPEISDEGTEGLFERLDQVLESTGAVRLLCDDLGKRKLAYEIQKFHKGHYYILYFLDEGQSIPQLERLLRMDESVLRFMTIVANERVMDVEGRKAEAKEREVELAKRAAERAAREAEEAKAREAEEAQARADAEVQREAQAEAAAAAEAAAVVAAAEAAEAESAEPEAPAAVTEAADESAEVAPEPEAPVEAAAEVAESSEPADEEVKEKTNE